MEAKELEHLCEKVYYYKRDISFLNHFSILPFTVKSRISKELKQNLLKNNYPILFEVLHTCFLLKDDSFKNRLKIYRHSNLEHIYYKGLAKVEKNYLKRVYLNIEAIKLKRFEKIIQRADLIFAVNKKDSSYFKENYPAVNTIYLPSFHSNNELTINADMGEYALYHGNLSIPENYEAVEWILNNIATKVNYNIIIAGLNAPPFLKNKINTIKHCKLIDSPSEAEMNKLIEEAQLHLLYTAQDTGLKLKLLNVLFKGRFILTNSAMLSGTDLSENNGLIICNSHQEYNDKINTHSKQMFTEAHKVEREKLVKNFKNTVGAEIILKEISH